MKRKEFKIESWGADYVVVWRDKYGSFNALRMGTNVRAIKLQAILVEAGYTRCVKGY